MFLKSPELMVAPPTYACVVIDPNDQVLESAERAGTREHSPVCPRLPDLEIRDVSYSPAGSGRIRVTVRNSGDGAIRRRRIVVRTLLPDGTYLDAEDSLPFLVMEPGDEESSC